MPGLLSSAMGHSSRSDSLQQFRELVGALAPALVEPHLLVLLAVLDRPMAGARRIARPAVAQVLEGDDRRHERFFGWLPSRGESVREDEFFVLDDLQVDAGIGVVIAIGIAHHDQAGAARPDIQRHSGNCPGPRHEPLLQELGLGPGAIHFFARRVEDALQHQLALAREIGADIYSDVHRFLLEKPGHVPMTNGPRRFRHGVAEILDFFQEGCQEAGFEARPCGAESRSRCMRMWAASAAVLAREMARSNAARASVCRLSCIKSPPLTPKKWKYPESF